jgi:hypothetical protein
VDFVTIARAAKIVAIVGFLLPWVTYSCAGQPVATLSGVDLAIGQFALRDPANGAIEHQSSAPNIWLILALITIALGLAVGFLVNGSNTVRLMLASSLGAFALSIAGMVAAHDRDQPQASTSSGQKFDQAAIAGVGIDNRYGFYISLVALAAAAGACLVSLTYRPRQ